jgi:hypothetical protein
MLALGPHTSSERGGYMSSVEYDLCIFVRLFDDIIQRFEWIYFVGTKMVQYKAQ